MKKIKAYLSLVVLFIISMIVIAAMVMFIIDYWPGELTMQFTWIGLVLLLFSILMLQSFFDCFKKYHETGILTDNRQKVGIMEVPTGWVVYDIKTCDVIEGSKYTTRGLCLNFIAAYPNLYILVDKTGKRCKVIIRKIPEIGSKAPYCYLICDAKTLKAIDYHPHTTHGACLKYIKDNPNLYRLVGK